MGLIILIILSSNVDYIAGKDDKLILDDRNPVSMTFAQLRFGYLIPALFTILALA